MKSTAKILKLLRENRGLSQNDIAKLFNIDRTTYLKYEQTGKVPTEKIKALANFFNVSTDYLLGRTDIAEPIDSYIKKYNQMPAQAGGSLQLTDEERAMIEKYRQLPDKAKGKIEERIDMEMELQKEKTPPEAKRA